ncbi:ABC transporter ATP-binding protein [Aquaticitalea lipolytica]|uniref:ABC transporter ATP-binding protein n=1 Tax=Aquaticitalea lipolytica TaxID=1247562 RepID=A0A8J2XJ16_9FLAO|nr:ATP-binding cassette domain-containing protein [Aquaticitalea lipolytica]GFZ87110.1 ABC transporter ATP-binding protein [Aquaticitalea lipolytica]
MILEIDSIELYFSSKRILNGVYLKAETGKVTGILGSNGSGKSCLMNIIFGSLQPKYKLIRIDNEPILKPLYTINCVGFLPQHALTPNNIKVKTVFKLFRLDWLEFITVFESFSLFKNSKINSLSGGERRVLETYLILKSKNEIVILDEPFSHIAPLYIEKFKRLIAIEKQTKAIIITDHYFRDVIDTSDELYLLKNGCTKLINNLEELEDYKYLSIGSLD